jgi:hypothetical protein
MFGLSRYDFPPTPRETYGADPPPVVIRASMWAVWVGFSVVVVVQFGIVRSIKHAWWRISSPP